MMEVFFFSFCLFISQLFLNLSFPLLLGGFILLVSVFLSLIAFFNFGALFSLSFFLIMIGGILVVFGYTIALVTWVKDKKHYVNISKEVSIFFFLIFFMVCWLLVSNNFKNWSFYTSSDVLYFWEEWGLVVSLFGILLFCIMVATVGLAGKYKGALLK